MDKIKYILATFILTTLVGLTQAQPTRPKALGLGLNSTLYFYNSNITALPSIPLTPYLTFKIKQHEFILGPDLYPYIKKFTIIGGQAGYRYHFLKEDKPLHFFIDCNFQYAAFQFGCGIQPYDYVNTYPNICNDGALWKNKSLVNTYGVGLELNVFKRFSLYSIIGGGFNYSQIQIYQSWGGSSYIPNGDHTFLIAYLRAGLSFNIYKSKKNDECRGAASKKIKN